MKTYRFIAALACAGFLATSAFAQDVRITTFKEDSTFSLNGQRFTVTRDQNVNATIPIEFSFTSRACPPNCIQPMIAVTGVAIYGELKVLGFLETKVSDGAGLLLDVRTAINHLLSAGYPANKLSYYRGGMQAWRYLGLTVQ